MFSAEWGRLQPEPVWFLEGHSPDFWNLSRHYSRSFHDFFRFQFFLPRFQHSYGRSVSLSAGFTALCWKISFTVLTAWDECDSSRTIWEEPSCWTTVKWGAPAKNIWELSLFIFISLTAGNSSSPYFSAILNGNLNLSVALIILSTLLSPLTIFIWLSTLGLFLTQGPTLLISLS